MKEEALETDRPERSPLHSSGEENETGLLVEILGKPNRGRLEKAQCRFVGQGCLEDGFPKNPQADGDKGGPRTQKPYFPECRDLDQNHRTGTGCVTLGKPGLPSELSFLISHF